MTSESSYRQATNGDKMELERLHDGQPEDEKPIDIKDIEGGVTLSMFFAAFVCAMGSSFQMGYNIGVVNNPEKVVRAWISCQLNDTADALTCWNETTPEELVPTQPDWSHTNTFIWSVCVSIFCVGGVVGGLMSGWLADRMGRKGAMLFNNLFALIAAALMFSAQYSGSYWTLLLGRLVIGFNSGLNSGLAPMYLTEISPVNLRGAVGSIAQLVVTISILTAQLLGVFMDTFTLWPYLFGLTAVPAVFQILLLPFCPESPTYNLIVKNLEEQAEKDLLKLRGKDDVSAEIESMRREAARARAVKSVSFIDMFKFPLRWPLLVAVMMMFSQQLSGINVAMFYSKNVFNFAGLVDLEAQIATLIMGALNVAMTVVSVLLVERFGRRCLHLTGMAGMALTSVLICVFITIINDFEVTDKWAGYMCVIWVLLFVVSFATGPGSIPWFYVSELFRQSARGHANSIAVMANWGANFCVGLFFLPLKNLFHQYSFLFFTGFTIFFIIFTFLFAPETKGASIDVIVARFEQRKYLAYKD